MNAAGDSNYLNKAYSLYDVGAGVDTQEIGVCHYDASKRIISINDSAITPAGMQHVLSYYYYYSGSDTIPYKSMSVFSQTIPVGFDTTISYHFYDTQQRLIRDSVIEHAAIGDIFKTNQHL